MKKKTLLIILMMETMAAAFCACDRKNVDIDETTTVITVTKDEVDLADLSSEQFWIEQTDNKDEIIMTYEEIEAQNEHLMSSWGTDWTGGYYDVKAFPEKVEKEWLKDRICYMDLKNTKLYYKGESISEEQWEMYYDNYNLDAIPEEKNVLYAVTNENIPMLDLPTEDVLTDGDMDEMVNALQQTLLKINEPVAVLHDSSDSKWVFVVANEYIGWVKKEYCSFFETRQEWIDYQNRENFVVITRDCTIPETDYKLLMGTKLFMAAGNEDETSEEYIIEIPKKNETGLIQYEEISINHSESVCKGYLPFTREMVIKLAFQELGDSYGWGGAQGNRDCSSYVKDIYACFGFKLPRNSRLQQSMPDVADDMTSLSEEEKKNCVEKSSAGDILGINGHIMIYLGKANGKYYVINMLSSYVPEEVTEDFGNSIVSVNQVMVNSLNVKRRNGNTWLQELKGIVNFN